jgi:hypothetical protein
MPLFTILSSGRWRHDRVGPIHLRNPRLQFTLRVRDAFPYNPEDFVALARLDGWRGPKVSMLA